MIKKIVKGLWVFFALMVLAGIAVFASIAYGWIGYMPPVEELELQICHRNSFGGWQGFGYVVA